MKTIILITIQLILLSCKSEIKKSNTVNASIVPSSELVLIDSLQNFPLNRNTWFTVKTTNLQAVAEIIGLENYTSKNWKFALNKYNWNPGQAYISPVINRELVLVIGQKRAFYPNSKKLVTLLEKLSSKFGEVNYYYNYYSLGVSENSNVACIAKFDEGKLIRFIYYKEVDEIIELGKITSAEKIVGLKGKIVRSEYDETLTQSYQKDPEGFEDKYRDEDYFISIYGDVFKNSYVPWIDADFVYDIAEEWDLNPRNMRNNKNYSIGLGLFGDLTNCFCSSQ